MSEPSFSVIIPAHNEAELVGSAIQSVLRQSRPDWEAIVVDDGSTDGTAETVREYERRDPRISLVQQANAGLSAARNTGIEVARAPFLSFLDSDDLFMPDYLEAMGAALESTPDAGFGYTDAWALNADTHRIGRATAMSEWTPDDHPAGDPVEMIRLLIPNNFIFVATTVPRAVLDEVGVFDEELFSAEDYDLWLRILARGHRAVRPAGGVLAIKRQRPTAMSANHVKMLTNLCLVYDRVAADRALPADIRDAAQRRSRNLARTREAFLGQRAAGMAKIRLRRMVSRPLHALLRGWEWPKDPPREVAEAFPDLDRL
jgi:glycosyltransferase involved in cell wall biosynthesis